MTAIDTSGNESGFSVEVDKLISEVQDTTPPLISNITSNSITTASASIAWLTDEFSDTQIEYGTSTAYGSMSPLNTFLTTNHSQILSGLASATLYNYRVYSRDAAGNLQISGNNTFTTESPVDTTAPTISGVDAGSISTTAAAITWTTNEAADAQLEYGTTSAYGDFSAIDPTLATTHSINLNALSANTTYQYRVLSRDAAGNLATSGNRSFQTLDVPDTTPPVISGITESGLTATSMIITWSTDEGATSQVDYGTTSAYGSSSENNTLVTAHSRTLSGLSPATTYNYQIRSSDAEGNETVSLNRTFTTEENTGLIVTNLNVGSGLAYEIISNGFSNGATAYIDRSYTFSGVPAALSGAIYIKTANNDKNSTGNPFLTFNITEDVDVYVAHDDRIVRPSWLSAFVDTGNNIIVDEKALSLFKRTFAAGQVSIGGNEGLGSATKMYVVIIDGVQTNPGDITPPVLTGMNATSITESKATITWSSDEAASSQVEFGLGNFASASPINTTLVTSHSVTLVGLSPSTSYQYRVVSRDAFNNASFSGTFSFTTQDIPVVSGPELSNITASEITDRSAKITWNTDRDATAQVSFGETSAYGMSTTENEALLITHSRILNGLKAETIYYYQVISADADGNPSFSENQTFTTGAAPVVSPGDGTPPAPVEGFSASSGFRKLMLSWTNPSDSDFRGVRIYYRTDRPPTSFDEAGTIFLGDFIGSPGQRMSSTHVGLENNVSYYYAAASFDVLRNYQNSVQVNATTFNPASKTSSEEQPFTTGGCGMIKPGGGDPPGPGQAAEMILMFGIILLLLFKKRLKANNHQLVKISSY